MSTFAEAREKVNFLMQETILAYTSAQHLSANYTAKGFAQLNIPHYAYHYFRPQLHRRNMREFMLDITEELIPALNENPHWSTLVPDLLRIVNHVNKMDDNRYVACDWCREL